MRVVKNQINIIIVVGILVLLTAASGCISGGGDTGQSSDSSDVGDATDSSVNTPTQGDGSSQSIDGSDVCTECGGTGVVSCYNTVTGGESCAGTGIVTGGSTEGSICRICEGTGQITCPTCGGSGTL